jgi:2-polyprenyl-3-methyl-5-hydroxy-6-metoxy-1,4-benzoquinol methylase
VLDSKTEISAGQRFAFGANWNSFARLVDNDRIATATSSLVQALRCNNLTGKSFLDIGCGSGLFSLAARRLGAEVHSFDFDADSVATTKSVRERFAPGPGWTVESGSIVDLNYTATLGSYDVVYSWGVLHHTGQMWKALAAAADLVAPDGHLFISIYNDQGRTSRAWRQVKRRYNRSGRAGRMLLVAASSLYLYRHLPVRAALWAADRVARSAAATGQGRLARAPRTRGMSRRHDLIDWVGGYPFEVARPEEVFGFLADRGFELRYLTTCGAGLGCNEYVFQRVDTAHPAEV